MFLDPNIKRKTTRKKNTFQAEQKKCFLHILLLYDTRTAFIHASISIDDRITPRVDCAIVLFTLDVRLNKQQTHQILHTHDSTLSQCNLHHQWSAIKTSSKSYTTHWSIKLHKKIYHTDDPFVYEIKTDFSSVACVLSVVLDDLSSFMLLLMYLKLKIVGSNSLLLYMVMIHRMWFRLYFQWIWTNL